MKRLIMICACLALWPAVSNATPATLLNDSETFTVAAAQKLGTIQKAFGTPEKGLNTATPSTPKETLECTRDGNCANDQKCNTATNKCVSTCSLATCSNGKFCVAGTSHSYSCKDCLTDTNCTAGKKCSGNSCISCSEGDENCRCPSGEVADGKGGCKTAVPASCDVFNNSDPTSHYWNANGSHTVPKGLRCWDGYGANATISSPGDVVHDYVRIRFWQGATVNGPVKTKELQFLYNTSTNANTITFNGPVTVNGVIKIQRSVTPVFKGGISGSYTCEYYDCVNQYGPCNNKTVEACKWETKAVSCPAGYAANEGGLCVRTCTGTTAATCSAGCTWRADTRYTGSPGCHPRGNCATVRPDLGSTSTCEFVDKTTALGQCKTESVWSGSVCSIEQGKAL